MELLAQIYRYGELRVNNRYLMFIGVVKEDIYGLVPELLKSDGYDYGDIYVACTYGDFPITTWLIQLGNIDIDRDGIMNLLFVSSSMDFKYLYMWLVEYFNISKEDTLYPAKSMLYNKESANLIMHCSVDALKWFSNRFNWTSYDVLCTYSNMVRMSCNYDFDRRLLWLAISYKLEKEDGFGGMLRYIEDTSPDVNFYITDWLKHRYMATLPLTNGNVRLNMLPVVARRCLCTLAENCEKKDIASFPNKTVNKWRAEFNKSLEETVEKHNTQLWITRLTFVPHGARPYDVYIEAPMSLLTHL
jgi:hypothetical protein